MLGTHVFIGVGEALITVGALALIKSARPDLLQLRDAGPPPPPAHARDERVMIRRYWWLAGLLLAVAVVVVLAPLASSDPDGLERVAIDAGFAEQGRTRPSRSCPTTACRSWVTRPLSLIVAGLIGVALLFGAMWLLGRVPGPSRPTDRLTSASPHGARSLHPAPQPRPPRRRAPQDRARRGHRAGHRAAAGRRLRWPTPSSGSCSWPPRRSRAWDRCGWCAAPGSCCRSCSWRCRCSSPAPARRC